VTRSGRFKPVVRFAALKSRQQARLLQECARLVQEGERRLKLLQGYQREYLRRFIEQGTETLDAGALRNYGAFVSRLFEAAEQERCSMAEALGRFEREKRRWLAAHDRYRALRTLAEDSLRRERDAQERRTQQSLDDRVRPPPDVSGK
jgi:flagellar FliJ protein